jgi:Xaa-Pro dipeptidase
MAPDSLHPRKFSVTRSKKTQHRTELDNEPGLDMPALRAYRLGRLRAELKKRDYMGILLYDPINIRYATGTRNMAVWTLHNATRYAFVPTEGPITLFDFHNCEHLSHGIETVAETRLATSYYFFGAGPRGPEKAEQWAKEIADLVQAHGGGNKRLAVDKLEPLGTFALQKLGIELHEGQEPCEIARSIKNEGELALMSNAIAVCEIAMAEMRAMVRPGVTENQLWAKLNEANAARGGEWIETRILSSGGRTNPWFAESSDRMVRPGELVSFDTDLIGPYGYCSDLSRTYFCGPGKPSAEQKRLYGLAYEQIHHNMGLLKPGLGFRELAETAWKMPESCLPNRYSVVVHGVGLCDEYPGVIYKEDYEKGGGYDGVFEAGMTVCVESYMGELGGDEGVKLEQQVLITDNGVEQLSTFPFEEDLLPSRWL